MYMCACVRNKITKRLVKLMVLLFYDFTFNENPSNTSSLRIYNWDDTPIIIYTTYQFTVYSWRQHKDVFMDNLQFIRDINFYIIFRHLYWYTYEWIFTGTYGRGWGCFLCRFIRSIMKSIGQFVLLI